MSVFRVLVDAAPRLAAESPGGHVLLQQRAGTELLAEGALQEPEDREARVEAYEVHELERAHRVIETELERRVDIACTRDTLLQHVERFVTDHRVDATRDEAGRLAHDDALLAHALAHRAGQSDRVLA